jgi:CDP-diacylglycerol--glycerol-3-phosphate 3-phosphatidyltransferase
VFDARWRPLFERALGRPAKALRGAGVTADELTAFGLVMAVGAGVAIGKGFLGLGLGLLIVSAIPDLLDGAVAKAAGTVSARGAFFDSVADRVSDSLLLGGFAWYLARTGHGEVALVPFLLLALSFLISYERAKAESLGYSARGGLMERGERLFLLAVALAFSSVMLPVLWVMVVLSGVTALQRFAKVWRQASSDLAPRPARARAHPPVPEVAASGMAATGMAASARRTASDRVRSERPFRAARVESRWRAWREAAGQRADRPSAGKVTRRWRARRDGAPIGRSRARREGAAVSSPLHRRRRPGNGGGGVLSAWRDGTGSET